MPSFDIVSEVSLQEVDNAVNQARKELSSRYDFKGCICVVDLVDSDIKLTSDSAEKVSAMLDVLNSKLFKRGIEIESLEVGKIVAIGGKNVTQSIKIKSGIDILISKKIVKFIKETGFKVDCQIQGDLLRINAKKIDDLQSVIGVVRAQTFGAPLQFKNMRP